MSVRLFIKDKVNGKVHEYGTSKHDSLMLNDENGSLEYYNLQTGDSTGKDGSYSFCKADGSNFDTNESYEIFANIGGDHDYPEFPICNEHFGSLLICAIRYCFGRQTYMPSLIIGFITPMIPKIDNKTLFVLERDVRESGRYGDPKIDKPYWLKFLDALQAEIKKRKENGVML